MLSTCRPIILLAGFACGLAFRPFAAPAADRIIPAVPAARVAPAAAPENNQAQPAARPAGSFEDTPLRFPESAGRRRLGASEDRPRPIPSVFSVLFYVFVICGLFTLVLWALKRYVPGHRQLFTHPALEVLGRSHLDPRRYVSLLRVGRRIVVIGVSPEGLSPLSEITDGGEIAEILEVARPKAEMGLNLFQKLFQRHVVDVERASEKGEVENRARALREEVVALRGRIGEDERARQAGRLDRLG
ncbi:MAG: flagellar biosynthetic protein FliO [Planctomycetota bacterium]|jgi:flagellar biogenesis protein FliO|nr:flagellar biosynthetic protein FliO [Planctomycetota bacterium]